MFNGLPAPVYFARTDQLNVQVPYEISGTKEANVLVTYQGASLVTRSSAVVVPVRTTHPGVLPQLFNQDGSPNSATNPAATGSIIILFATGQGVTNPASPTGAFPVDVYPRASAPVSLDIGGQTAELAFQGQAPGTAGVMQVNAKVPAGVPTGATRVTLLIGEERTQDGVVVWVRQ